MKPLHGRDIAESLRSAIQYCFFAAGTGALVGFGTFLYLKYVSNVPDPLPSEIYHSGFWTWLAIMGLHVAFTRGISYGRFVTEAERREKEAREAMAEWDQRAREAEQEIARAVVASNASAIADKVIPALATELSLKPSRRDA
jgi:cobalamin biosynthesis protein CobD/CbiB